MPRNPVPRDERITAAALELLRAKGPKAVTVEAVAARADVAKTTIYRRYRDRQEMLAAALTSLTQPPPPPDTSAAAPILEWLIDQCHDAIEEGIGVGGVAALLTDEDPAFTKLSDRCSSSIVKHSPMPTAGIEKQADPPRARRRHRIGLHRGSLPGRASSPRSREAWVGRSHPAHSLAGSDDFAHRQAIASTRPRPTTTASFTPPNAAARPKQVCSGVRSPGFTALPKRRLPGSSSGRPGRRRTPNQ